MAPRTFLQSGAFSGGLADTFLFVTCHIIDDLTMTMNLKKNAKELIDWWYSIPRQWREFFNFNYLVKNDIYLFANRCDHYSEPGGVDVNNKIVFHSTDLNKIVPEHEVPAVIHFTLNTEHIFNYDYDFCYATGDGDTQHQTSFEFWFDSLEPLKYLTELETLYLGSKLKTLDISFIKELKSIRQIDLDFKFHKHLDQLVSTFSEVDEINIFADYPTSQTSIDFVNFENSLRHFSTLFPKIDIEIFVKPNGYNNKFDIMDKEKLADLVGTYFYDE